MYEGKRSYTFMKLIVFCIISSALFALMAKESFVLFHSLIELLIVASGLGLFMIAYVTNKISDNDYFSFMGATYGTVALINVFHLFTYKGLDIITTGTNASTQLWLAQRFFEVISLMISFRYLNKRVNIKRVILINLITFVLILLSIFTYKIFPDAFFEGEGLTSFKVFSEYITAVLFLFMAFMYYKNAHLEFLQDKVDMIIVAMVLKAITGLVFVLYISAYDINSLVGHIFNYISYVFLFAALIRGLIEDPKNSLFLGLTEQLRAAEREKLEMENKLNNLIYTQSIHNGILSTAPKGVIVADGERIIYVNSYIEELLKVNNSDRFLGRSLQEIFDVTCHEYLKKSIELLRTGNTLPIERCLLRWDRIKIPVGAYSYTFVEDGRRYLTFVIEEASQEAILTK